MSEPPNDPAMLQMTADIVSAYVQNHKLAPEAVSALVANIHGALASVGGPPPPAAADLKPAVSVRKSITPEFLISLEDGKPYKSLKRHLQTKYGLTPEQYRQKWGLPKDYPMVAPNYAASRSAMAKAAGLGRIIAKPAPAAAVKAKAPAAKTPAATTAAVKAGAAKPAARRGRNPKA